MSDRDPKKERVFGCGAQDPAARLQGREIVRQGRDQSISAVNRVVGDNRVTPGVEHLKNR